MIAVLDLVSLVVATVVAGAAAVALQWLLIRVAMQLMRPATARQIHVRTELARGTMQLARAFSPRR